MTLLFMFDGRERPKVKRGSRMGKSGSHPHARGFKEMIELFGWDWREVRASFESRRRLLSFPHHHRDVERRREEKPRPSSRSSTKSGPLTLCSRTTSTVLSSGLA